jgi:hypothetical protein
MTKRMSIGLLAAALQGQGLGHAGSFAGVSSRLHRIRCTAHKGARPRHLDQRPWGQRTGCDRHRRGQAKA